MSNIDQIPEDWWIERPLLDPEKVGASLHAAADVVKQWQFARIDYHPLIEALVHLRETLRVDKV